MSSWTPPWSVDAVTDESIVTRSDASGIEIKAYRGGQPIGILIAQPQVVYPASGKPKKALMVSAIEVAEAYRVPRQGIGTEMYELAAKTACDVYGLPLASDINRSGYAEAFWQKQARRKRAKSLRLGELVDMETVRVRDTVFLLKCPPPVSLAALRRRMRR